MNTPKIVITPRRAAVLAGFDNTLDVLVRVVAPDAPEDVSRRRGIRHVALVIDRSGSMSGEPLAEAIRCARFVIAGLAPTDYASLLVYDDEVRTLVPLTSVRDREAFERALRAITEGGCTNLHGGWFAGAESLAARSGPGVVSRVILLSDGCANRGLLDPTEIWRQCGELAAAGITTSTYGLGRNFNEELMIGMARAGGGNSYYGMTAQDLMDPFREELALLDQLCARGLVMELATPKGVRAEVLNGYRSAGPNGWHLPDLAYGGEAWALVRLTLPRSLAVAGSVADLLTATVRCTDNEGAQQPVPSGRLTAPVVPESVFQAIAEDELVARRATELETATVEDEARAAAHKGDWAKVDRLLAQVERLAASNPWLQGVCAELQRLAGLRDQGLFVKEVAFASNRKRTRLASRDEGLEGDVVDQPVYIRRKASQGTAQPASPRTGAPNQVGGRGEAS